MYKFETARLLSLIKTAYPGSYKKLVQNEVLETIEIWYNVFPNISFDIMELALKNLQISNTFAPTILEMIAELRGLHYWAFGCALMAKSRGDDRTMQYYLWVMDQTRPYLEDAVGNIGVQDSMNAATMFDFSEDVE